MTEFRLFRHKSTGVIDSMPADSAEHPVYGYDLEPYEPDEEHEEDKVVFDTHSLPVEQRVQRVSTEKQDKKDN